MTAQEIFNIVWDHLITKAAPKSVVHLPFEDKKCLYRGPNGTKCAIGALVTDEECEGWGNWAVHQLVEKGRLPERLEGHLYLLENLQDVHDLCDVPSQRLGNMVSIAKLHNLSLPEGFIQ